MQTALVLLVVLIVALAMRRRLLLVAVAAVSAWVLIPGAAGGSITGITGLHPATVLVIVSFILEVVNPKALLRQAIVDHRLLYIALSAFLVLSAGFTFRLGSGGTMTFLNVILAPILLFVLVDAARVQRTVRSAVLARTMVALGCLEAVLGLVQAASAQNLFWVNQLAQYSWYSTEFNRAQGTLDRPILLGMLCAACIPVAGTFKRMSVTTVACVVLTLGVIVSQTRSAIPAALQPHSPPRGRAKCPLFDEPHGADDSRVRKFRRGRGQSFRFCRAMRPGLYAIKPASDNRCFDTPPFVSDDLTASQ